MLEIRNLSVVFGGLLAVDDLCLSVKQGDLKGLIGPNGAGKTTVFNAITGVYPPSKGEIYLNGTLLNCMETHKICRLGIARTFQNLRLFKNLTARDNVKIALDRSYKYTLFDAFVRTPRCRRAERAIATRADEWLARTDLSDYSDTLAKNLPYGLQKRLEIARALATNPSILLLDEPAAGLNDTETVALMERIRELRDEFNLGILLIEHDMKLVMGICEQISVIEYGKQIAEGSPSDIQSNSRVIEAYLGTKKGVPD